MRKTTIFVSTLLAAAAFVPAFADDTTTTETSEPEDIYPNVIGATAQSTSKNLKATLDAGTTARNFSPIKVEEGGSAIISDGLVSNVNGSATNAVFGGVVTNGESDKASFLSVSADTATYAIEFNLGATGAVQSSSAVSCGGLNIQDSSFTDTAGNTVDTYSGNASSSTVNGNIHVAFAGGTLEGSFFSGNRAWTDMKYATTDTTSTTERYTISSTISGQVFTEVSGGSAHFLYGGGYYSTGAKATTGSTKVVITGGTFTAVFASDYVSGLGAETNVSGTVAEITGSTEVSISGGTISETVFGGGNLENQNSSGLVKFSIGGGSTVSVSGVTLETIIGGSHIQAYQSEDSGKLVSENKGIVTINVDNGAKITSSIYGGDFIYDGTMYNTGAAEASVAGVSINIMNGSTAKEVYGGGRTFEQSVSAKVAGDVNITVDSSTVSYRVCGSGYGETSTVEGNVLINVSNNSDVSGIAGSWQHGKVSGDVSIKISDSRVGSNYLYGAYNGTVAGNVSLDVSNGSASSMIIGAADTGTIAKDVNISVSGDSKVYWIYGTMGASSKINGNVKIDVSGGNVSNIIACQSDSSAEAATTIDGNVEINITGGTVGDIYAGGYNNTVTKVGGNATVTISGENTVVNGGVHVRSGTVMGTSTLVLKDVSIKLRAFGFDKISAVAGSTGKVTIDGGIAAGGTSIDVSANTELKITSSSDAVSLSSSAAFAVNKAEAIATADVSLPDAGDATVTTLAAWAFDITKTETDEITVTLQLSSGLDGDAIRVYHKADSATTWEDYSDTVTEKTYDATTGTLKFKTKSFSSYAAGTTQVIPEPSAFGLLAGIGALALAISRRRRKN